MGKRIVECRICKSKRLKYALKFNGKTFVICQTCTLLQREADIPYDITFDLSSGGISVDYYPYYLLKNLPVSKDTCVMFSLKSIEVLLELKGYRVMNAQTTDEGKLEVYFQPLDSLDRIRLFEMAKKLSSQFTYFLYSIKKK